MAIANQDSRHRFAMQNGECVGITARKSCQTESSSRCSSAGSTAVNPASNLTHQPRRIDGYLAVEGGLAVHDVEDSRISRCTAVSACRVAREAKPIRRSQDGIGCLKFN